MAPSLLDTDTLSEIIKGRHATVRPKAVQYLVEYESFSFSLMIGLVDAAVIGLA
jgi:hypothetical protein